MGEEWCLMPISDELGLRMKEYYEMRSRTFLMRRCPVAIRIDGKAFHTFTRGFDKPFDKVLGVKIFKVAYLVILKAMRLL